MKRSILLAISLVLFYGSPLNAVTHEWTRQHGTRDDDKSYNVSADGLGNVCISGYTNDDLGGTNAGGTDVFVSKFDADGNQIWARQFGTARDDGSNGVSADRLGNVYFAGYTYSGPGGAADALVGMYDDAGNLLWTDQLGTVSADLAHGASADGLGNVYVSGDTYGDLGGTNNGLADAFLSKYDNAGNLLWTSQLGSTNTDHGFGVSADGLGNVYISGHTGGTLGDASFGYYDAYVSKYNASGELLWTKQLGTASDDRSFSVSADGLGHVYISGYTDGDLGGTNIGLIDAFVSKYDDGGNLLWTTQLGTEDVDVSRGVSADGLGNVYITGYTYADLGKTYYGLTDAFVSKLDAAGTLLWSEQLGTVSNDHSFGVSADGLGNVYISGDTYACLGDTSAGRWDAFLAKYSDPIPEPTSGLLTLYSGFGCLLRRRR